MRRVEGTSDVRLVECVNPVKGKWRIRWDVQPGEDGAATYMEEEFQHKPTVEEIRKTIIGWYNRQTDEAILSGFEYDGNMVWLSSQNQFDYKAEHDLAVQTGGATLPVTYIRETLAAGRKRKDALDMSLYET